MVKQRFNYIYFCIILNISNFHRFNNMLKDMDSPEIYTDVALSEKTINWHPLLYATLLCNNVTFLDSQKNKLTVKKDWLGKIILLIYLF